MVRLTQKNRSPKNMELNHLEPLKPVLNQMNRKSGTVFRNLLVTEMSWVWRRCSNPKAELHWDGRIWWLVRCSARMTATKTSLQAMLTGCLALMTTTVTSLQQFSRSPISNLMKGEKKSHDLASHNYCVATAELRGNRFL